MIKKSMDMIGEVWEASAGGLIGEKIVPCSGTAVRIGAGTHERTFRDGNSPAARGSADAAGHAPLRDPKARHI
ncbi:MAG: hypothetical protein AAF667_01750 [Pseudomonadota bacterium]